MKQSRWFCLVAAFFMLCFAASELFAQAADPANGTWELNLAKSKFASGPASKSQTRTYEVVGERLTYTNKVVDADGKSRLVQFTVNYDGKDYPETGEPSVDMISYKRIDRFTIENIEKKAGKVVARNRRVVSADGKVMTVTSVSTNEKGETLMTVLVFDKK